MFFFFSSRRRHTRCALVTGVHVCSSDLLRAAGTPISIDTRKASVMHAALAAGAHLVNDVSALLWDDRALDLVVRAGCPVILMHSPDPAKGPHGGNGYADVLTEEIGRAHV